MKIGDLVWIASKMDSTRNGIGIYLGRKSRGTVQEERHYAFLWKGRVATFEPPFWSFSVIGTYNENR